jgi:hypothetical protein
MISINLSGGLGNYMFQVAAAYSLSIDNNDTLILDEKRSIKVHNDISNYKNNIFRNFTFGSPNISSYHNEPFFHYKEIPYQPNLLLSGYFQSEKYFVKNRKKILELFSIDDYSQEIINKKYNHINFNDSCSLHIRRGDYLRYPNIHPVCSTEYYEKSVNLINSKTILIFSDDLNWCKENLSFKDKDLIFIKNNPDYIDLWLMSLCSENIIANSTFSWWGSWLNKNINKNTIVPNIWFGNKLNHDTKDLIPDKWIKI